MDKRVTIRFFDSDINFIGEIDNYNTLIYISKWKTYGQFEIHTAIPNERLFQEGHLILLNNDPRKSGIIKYVKMDDKDGGEIQIKGFSLLYLLTQRITIPPSGKAYHEFTNTTAEDIIISLVKYNAVSPVDGKRKIPKLVTGNSEGRGGRLSYQTRYDGLVDCLSELCTTSGLGVCISLDPVGKQFIFEVLEGIDRSVNQTERPPMIFNVNYDNISYREYTTDASEYKNCAYTGGQGDGVERVIRVVGGENAGLERYELFVDARDVEDANKLTDRGKVKLSESQKITAYNCEADTDLFEKKWSLGDVVTTKDAEWGLLLHERIMEVQESLDADGYTVEPTFGAVAKSIAEKVNMVAANRALLENTKGDPGAPGSPGEQGYSIQYQWDGTKLGVKREDEAAFLYTDLQGPKGDDGHSATYIHTQMSALSVWSIEHNLDKYPSVDVVDSAGTVVCGNVQYVDRNHLTVEFSAAFAGMAYLN